MNKTQSGSPVSPPPGGGKSAAEGGREGVRRPLHPEPLRGSTLPLQGRVKLVFVVAVAQNRIIGADNGLPWRLSSDLRRFRQLTWGKPLIMGRRTWESIGRPLPGRETIAVSRDPDFGPADVHVARDPEEALFKAGQRAESMGANEIIVAGGAQIYEAYLGVADLIHLTEVAIIAEGDVLFPELDPSGWREIARETPARTEKDEADFSWITLERMRE